MHARLLHLQPEVVALTGALAHAGEHRHAAVLAGDADDHLLDHHGLADAGPAEQADLAAEAVGLEQVDDLQARLEHAGLGVEVVEGGRRAVDLPAVVDALGERARRRVSRGSPMTLNTWPSVPLPTGTVMPRPRFFTGVPRTRPSVGFMADGPHPAVADVLGHLGDDDRLLALDLHGELEGAVQLGQVVGRELDVDDGADDGDDAPVLERAWASEAGCSGICGERHVRLS